MLYLYLLRGNQAPTQKIMEQIMNQYRLRFGDVTILGGQRHDGPLPTEPDIFVVSTCLLVCKNKGIAFDSHRDEISYGIDILAGEKIGACRIKIKSPITSSIPTRQEQERVKSDGPVHGSSHALKSKDKTAAVLLAVFLGFWTWCYTYKKDAWKFWLNLGLSLVSIGYWLPVAWIWAIIDASRRPAEFYINFGQSIISQPSVLSTQTKVPQVQEIQNERNVGSSAIGQTSNNVPRLPSPPPWSLSTITVILFATTLLPPIGFVVGLIALMKAKTRIIGVMFLGISIVYIITWIPFTPIGGILFCLVFTCIIVFSRPPKCENCGQTIPKVRTTFPSLRQALLGGGVCPNCGTEVDRKGRIKR